MPQIGDKKRGKEFKPNGNRWYIYTQCPKCEEFRWKQVSKSRPIGDVCIKCSRNKYGIILRGMRESNDSTI